MDGGRGEAATGVILIVVLGLGTRTGAVLLRVFVLAVVALCKVVEMVAVWCGPGTVGRVSTGGNVVRSPRRAV